MDHIRKKKKDKRRSTFEKFGKNTQRGLRIKLDKKKLEQCNKKESITK